MNHAQLAKEILSSVGGKGNVAHVTNCMTRLRMTVIDVSQVDFDKLKSLDGVMGVVTDETLQVVLGPGTVKRVFDEFVLLIGLNAASSWTENKEVLKGKEKKNKFKQVLRTIGEIFIPLIPAIIAAGIFNGFSGLITNLQATGNLPQTDSIKVIGMVFSLIGGGFLSYFAIYTGINAARKFGATEALGGMLGAISIMPQIDGIAAVFGLFNADTPLLSILRAGKGGIIGVIIGVYVLAVIEKNIRKRIPDVLDVILTPIITLFISTIGFVFLIMPISGIFSDWLVKLLGLLVSSSNPVISVFSGFILAALFLPMVLLGLHHGLIPIYAIQLETLGAVTLFPVLAMAGAGQVGAAIAIYFKAKKLKNTYLTSVISGALPAGILGIGEPLIYGVTLPMGRPFVTAGIGAGFGGAYIMLTHVMATAWGPSGITAIPLMQPGSMLNYIIGLLVSYAGGYVVTQLFIRDVEVVNIGKDELTI